MGFYAPAQLIRNAREHGVEVRPIDVNHSRWDCTLEEGALRLGLRMIAGMPRDHGQLIEQSQPFGAIDDVRRAGVPQRTIERLAEADAFKSLQLNRRASLWESLRPAANAPLFQDAEDAESPFDLPTKLEQDEVFADYKTTGVSLRAHPLRFFRSELDRLRITTASRLADLPDASPVQVAGLVLVRQRPGTAKGVTFVTLEDETGVANLIIRLQVWNRFRDVARTAPALIAGGRLQNQQGVLHVLVNKLENLNDAVGGLRSRSRDFH